MDFLQNLNFSLQDDFLEIPFELGTHEIIDGQVDGSVDRLEEFHNRRGVEEPEGYTRYVPLMALCDSGRNRSFVSEKKIPAVI